MPPSDRSIVLFDGVCNLCNASVNFIIDRDPGGRVAFAPLQSPIGQSLSKRFGLPTTDLKTLVLIEGDECFTRSTAALRVARRLRFPWPLARAFLFVPRPLRDAAYDFVARRRYRWFGRRDACRMPTPELAGRFLDEATPPL